MFNITFWERYIKKQFIAQLELLVESIEKRLIPTFDTIESEAEDIEQREWDNLLSSCGNPDVDPCDLAEQAFDAKLEYYEMVSSVKQALLNICATALYHSFEQQVLFMLRREILHPSQENIVSFLKIQTFKDELLKYRVDIEKFSSWPIIEELRLVSNSIKHAEGKSSEMLRQINHGIFINPILKKYNMGFHSTSPRLYMPLAGDDIYVQIKDLKKYRDAISAFWSEYISELSKID